MSSRNIYRDERILVPGSSTISYGRFFSLVSNGANQQAGVPLEDHNYTMQLNDYYAALISLTKCTTGIKRYISAVCGCEPIRVWDASDDYKLYEKLEGLYDQGDFNAGVFAGELGETADLCADRVKQLARAVRAAKKGNFRNAAEILASNGGKPVRGRPRNGAGRQDGQRVSAGWLELQYGWLPLCGDIYDLSGTLAQLGKPRMRRIRAKHWIGMKPYTSLPGDTIAEGEGRIRKQIIAEISEDIPSQAQALGLMDPEIVAWELVPFSFVIDWFLPIGGWLQARAFAARAKGKFTITSSTRYAARLTRSTRPSCPPPAGKSEKLELESLGWGRYVKVERSVLYSLPQVPLPSFGNGIGKGWRLMNAVALAAEIFTKSNGGR